MCEVVPRYLCVSSLAPRCSPLVDDPHAATVIALHHHCVVRLVLNDAGIAKTGNKRCRWPCLIKRTINRQHDHKRVTARHFRLSVHLCSFLVRPQHQRTASRAVLRRRRNRRRRWSVPVVHWSPRIAGSRRNALGLQNSKIIRHKRCRIRSCWILHLRVQIHGRETAQWIHVVP